jgi:hypothetical protein
MVPGVREALALSKSLEKAILFSAAGLLKLSMLPETAMRKKNLKTH